MAKATAPDTTALSVIEAATAIVALINSRAQSPWPQEIEAIIAKIAPGEAPARHASELGHKIRAAIARADEAEQAMAALSREAFEAASALADQRHAELDLLEERLPNPPMTFGDIVIRAELANFGADKDRDKRTMSALHKGDCFERPAARLIEAVLQFAGRSIGEMGSAGPLAPSDSPALSAEHLKYRQIVGEIASFEGADYPPGKSAAESEVALNALADDAMAIERKAWATPAKTLADVLLRGEIALYKKQRHGIARRCGGLLRRAVSCAADQGRRRRAGRPLCALILLARSMRVRRPRASA
jgi:hypothetical protein